MEIISAIFREQKENPFLLGKMALSNLETILLLIAAFIVQSRHLYLSTINPKVVCSIPCVSFLIQPYVFKLFLVNFIAKFDIFFRIVFSVIHSNIPWWVSPSCHCVTISVVWSYNFWNCSILLSPIRSLYLWLSDLLTTLHSVSL